MKRASARRRRFDALLHACQELARRNMRIVARDPLRRIAVVPVGLIGLPGQDGGYAEDEGEQDQGRPAPALDVAFMRLDA